MRIKADENTEASAASEAVTIRTKTVASEASVSYDYKAETIQFAETAAYEMNTDPAFGGASTSLFQRAAALRRGLERQFIRVKATAEDPAGPVVAVTVPVRPAGTGICRSGADYIIPLP